MALLNGIITVVAMGTFIGIACWAFSRSRAKANHEASLLPFALRDEGAGESAQGESHE